MAIIIQFFNSWFGKKIKRLHQSVDFQFIFMIVKVIHDIDDNYHQEVYCIITQLEVKQKKSVAL